ncbi:MAG: hypothetical protein SWO11_12420 [Thermodesulfobacteriota bacterium]|nr:hypothetical protein [Thermodesulfobacteriota bacterium]
MKRKVKLLTCVGITLAMLFFLSFLILPTGVKAKAKVVAIEGMKYNVNSSVKDNLNNLVGKKVYLYLDSGKTMSGFVKKVENHLIHLEKLDGKDFFDALIRIENISALEARFREYQR